jgi:hypothetical protein
LAAKVPALISTVFITLCAFSCTPPSQKPVPRPDAEQDLVLTFGGFLQGGDERQKLEGVCGTDQTRNVLSCDIYNGLQGWTVTELTFVITWTPYEEKNKRTFAQRVSIEPLKTEHVDIRLGLQLPPDTQFRNKRGVPIGQPQNHWAWLIVGAKGHRRG